jgi:hypothetical protein
VTAASALLWVMAVAGLIYAGVTIAVIPGVVHRFRSGATGDDVDTYVSVIWLGAAVALAVAVILFALYVVLGVALRRGSNSARIGTMVISVLGLLGGAVAAITVWIERSGDNPAGSLGESLSEAYPGGWIGTNAGLAVAQIVAYAIVLVLVLRAPHSFFLGPPAMPTGQRMPLIYGGSFQPGRQGYPAMPQPGFPPGYPTPGHPTQAPGQYGYGGPGQPGYAAPAPGQPGYAAPAPGQPGYAAPAPGQPGYVAPAPGQPGYAAPAAGQAGHPSAVQPGYWMPPAGQSAYPIVGPGQPGSAGDRPGYSGAGYAAEPGEAHPGHPEAGRSGHPGGATDRPSEYAAPGPYPGYPGYSAVPVASGQPGFDADQGAADQPGAPTQAPEGAWQAAPTQATASQVAPTPQGASQATATPTGVAGPAGVAETTRAVGGDAGAVDSDRLPSAGASGAGSGADDGPQESDFGRNNAAINGAESGTAEPSGAAEERIGPASEDGDARYYAVPAVDDRSGAGKSEAPGAVPPDVPPAGGKPPASEDEHWRRPSD